MPMCLTRKAVAFAAVSLSALVWLTVPAEALSFRQSSIGYHPQGAKVAILEDVPEDQKIEVVLFDPTKRNPRFPVLLGATVYKVENIQAFQEPGQQGPGTKNLLLDFSDFQSPGTYELRIEGMDVKSRPIKINDYLYWDNLKPVVRSFYFQRCGSDVEDRVLKLYHSACHLYDAALPEGADSQRISLGQNTDVIGGWHNGSDYAKYVTSTALSAARLMAMHEWGPKPFKYFRMDYPLFEPGYGSTDDLHHEIKVGLDWLMTMQRKDGSLHRKVAGKTWPGPKMGPVDDEQERYLYGISTQDTANAAAVWAMAVRDFKAADLGYSVKSLRAAERAWDFLEAHPGTIYQRSESDFSGSGEFLTPKGKGDLPYRVWAAAELYITTGKEQYHRYFLTHVGEVPLQRFAWTNPAIQGITDYLLYAQVQDPAVASALKANIMRMANGVQDALAQDIYAAGLGRYETGSNPEIAERTALLLTAYRLSGDARYRQTASRSATYLFGLNPMGLTYVTGLSEEPSVTHPAHRWSSAMGKVVPGLLVDGPNETAADGKTPAGLGARSYVDDAEATGSNESRLMNNASLAFLLAALNDAYNSAAQNEDQKPAGPLDFKLAPERAGSRAK
ncbi:glycoside hydrolase family 9 protein [Vampirovibrio sp.]|uniref:glycoside hydrolase family 9 protein n=1 Tax=Vampirovibrio sp. TaxID=2717857 RepID=UPI003592E9A6